MSGKNAPPSRNLQYSRPPWERQELQAHMEWRSHDVSCRIAVGSLWEWTRFMDTAMARDLMCSHPHHPSGKERLYPCKCSGINNWCGLGGTSALLLRLVTALWEALTHSPAKAGPSLQWKLAKCEQGQMQTWSCSVTLSPSKVIYKAVNKVNVPW